MKQGAKERLLKNYFHARKTWEAWCFLNNIDLEPSQSEIRYIANDNELLFYVRFILLKDLHIELYKILKDKRSSIDNIFFLLRKSNNKKAEGLLQKLQRNKKLVDDINNARDKFYAHLDENFEEYKNNLPIESLYVLFELIEEAIMILGLENDLNSLLKTIPSRNDFLLPN